MVFRTHLSTNGIMHRVEEKRMRTFFHAYLNILENFVTIPSFQFKKKNFMPSLLCLLFRLLEKGKEHVRYAGYTHHMVGCHLLFITKRYTKKRVMIYHFLAIQPFGFPSFPSSTM